MGLSTTYTKAEVDYLLQNLGAGQSSGLIEVTYNELVNLKNTSSLVKGQNYLLTDYMTTYTQPVTNVSKSSGVIEPLIITATNVDKLHTVCKSTLYPQDIVYYEITGEIGNEEGTEGFTKGKIYRRIDTLRNNDIGTDWRHVKYNRDGADKLLFENYDKVYNNKIETYNLFNSVIGFGFSSNTIGNYFYGNTIENWFSYNTIGDYFHSNTIGFGFSYNTIGGNFHYNTIGFGFSYNTIGGDFHYNTIGFGFSYNTIGGNFHYNTIGNYFSSNTLVEDFANNGTTLIPFTSQNTEFRNSISNVISSIEIQDERIDVVVFKSPNGIFKQRYYDDSNNLVINNL